MPGVPLRLKVLVRGASVAVNVGPGRASRAQGTFPEMLERRLRMAGVEAFVTNRSKAWEDIRDVFPEWYFLLAMENPDVVVINFGEVEAHPRILPKSWMATFNRRRAIPPVSRVGAWWARRADPLMRKLIARTVRFWSKRLGTRTHRVPPKRFEAEMERLITWTRAKTQGLVLVMTLNPAPPWIETLWHKLNERNEEYDEILENIVTRLADPDVRLVDVRKVVLDLGLKEALYDGLHYTPVAADGVAAMMEGEILDWLKRAER